MNWIQRIKQPLPYRVGGRVNFHTTPIVYTALLIFAAFLLLIWLLKSTPSVSLMCSSADFTLPKYNSVYPITNPLYGNDGSTIFKIAIVADPDTSTRKGADYKWETHYLHGEITYNVKESSMIVRWGREKMLTSEISSGGRGVELSELITFNGNILTVDDRTGIIYKIIGHQLLPWILLVDGNGSHQKGFKAEWMTVKDKELYVGGLGKEWTTPTGELQHFNPLWVKRICPNGLVVHEDWREKYFRVRERLRIYFPGYMIHEAVMWSAVHKRWLFLPRRVSHTQYNDVEDEKRGSNVLITADESFNEIETKRIGEHIPTRGFSSFKFLPVSDERIIVALKSEEIEGTKASFITAFDWISGEVILKEHYIASEKYEGIEFV